MRGCFRRKCRNPASLYQVRAGRILKEDGLVCGSKPFSASLSRILSPFLGGTRKGPPEGYPAEGPDRAFDKPSPARCAAIAPCGFLQNCPGHRWETIDKAPEMGYSKDTKGLPVERFPPSTTKRSKCELGSLGSYFFLLMIKKPCN